MCLRHPEQLWKRLFVMAVKSIDNEEACVLKFWSFCSISGKVGQGQSQLMGARDLSVGYMIHRKLP